VIISVSLIENRKIDTVINEMIDRVLKCTGLKLFESADLDENRVLPLTMDISCHVEILRSLQCRIVVY